MNWRNGFGPAKWESIATSKSPLISRSVQTGNSGVATLALMPSSAQTLDRELHGVTQSVQPFGTRMSKAIGLPSGVSMKPSPSPSL